MVILFDIGGSKMRFARTDNLRSFDEPVIVDNEGGYEEALATAAQQISILADDEPIKALVGGIAGTIDPRKGRVFASPNMPQWVGKDVAEDLRRLTGVDQVIIKNDADLAGLGEAKFGAGRGYEYVAYLTISTGVGGTLIADGMIVPSRYGFEPGHQFINDEKGETLELVAGGRHLEERYHKHPKELGEQIYNEVTQRLAVGVHNVAQLWSPDVIVMGGSQMRDISTEVIHRELQKMNIMFPHVPDVVQSELGSLNGVYGALAYAQLHVGR